MHGFPKSLNVYGKQIPFVFGSAYDLEVVDNDEIPEHERDVTYVPGWHKQPKRPKKTVHKEDHSAYLAISLTRWLRLTRVTDDDRFSLSIVTYNDYKNMNGSDSSIEWFDKIGLGATRKKLESGQGQLDSAKLIVDESLQMTFENEAATQGRSLISVARSDLPRAFTLAQKVLEQVGNGRAVEASQGQHPQIL